MAVKMYVKDVEEQQAAQRALSLISDAVDEYADNEDQEEHGSEDFEVTAQFLGNVQVVIGTAQLDTALMGEIGKAYKEKYEAAKAAGDKDTENKMIGAMFAVKKIMEMVSEPAY